MHPLQCSCGLPNCDHILGAHRLDLDSLAHHAPWQHPTGPAVAVLHETALRVRFFLLDENGMAATCTLALAHNWLDLITVGAPHLASLLQNDMGLRLVLRALRDDTWATAEWDELVSNGGEGRPAARAESTPRQQQTFQTAITSAVRFARNSSPRKLRLARSTATAAQCTNPNHTRRNSHVHCACVKGVLRVLWDPDLALSNVFGAEEVRARTPCR